MTNRDTASTTATSQSTVNYDLPLWSGGDITTWQGNLNDAMDKIDTALFENKTLMLGYKEIADQLEGTNSSTVELVNAVNAQLTEINTKYEEVKAGLEVAVLNITEANQAILNLQAEDIAVKAQLDEMRDDIGKLMEWHAGVWIKYNDVFIIGEDGTAHAKTHDAFLIGSSVYFRVIPLDNRTIPYSVCYITEEETENILRLMGLDVNSVTLIGLSSFLPREQASVDVWLDGNRLLFGMQHQVNIAQMFSCSAIYHMREGDA